MKEKPKTHRMSMTPQGTLTDLVETLFRGRGKIINVHSRNYTLREKGILAEDDPVREAMYRSLETYLSNYPTKRVSLKLNPSNLRIDKADYEVKFSRADEIPALDEDIGDHQYIIVEGVRYRMDEQGDAKKVGATTPQIIERGRKAIIEYLRVHGEFPDEIGFAARVN